jgi:hypothetical protein
LTHLFPHGQAVVGEVQPDGPPVRRVDRAPDQPGLLQRVDHGGDRPGHDPEPVRQLGHPQRLLRLRDDAQRAFLRGSEAERGELGHLRPPQPLGEPLEQVCELHRRLFVVHLPSVGAENSL